MANANKSAVPTAPTYPLTGMAIAALVVGWVIPGAGHLMQRKWIRGLLLLVSVFTMFFVGLAMQGKIYSPNTGQLLDILGFLGNIGAGGLYVLARILGWGQEAVFRATADYGTKYMIVAGLLNIVCAIDAYHIALGKKK